MSEMGMIERVSRVLCVDDGYDPDCTLSGDGVNFQWMSYERAAKVAVAAMREPTEGMSKAGFVNNQLVLKTRIPANLMGGQALSISSMTYDCLPVEPIWNAMIDAALGEVKQ